MKNNILPLLSFILLLFGCISVSESINYPISDLKAHSVSFCNLSTDKEIAGIFSLNESSLSHQNLSRYSSTYSRNTCIYSVEGIGNNYLWVKFEVHNESSSYHEFENIIRKGAISEGKILDYDYVYQINNSKEYVDVFIPEHMVIIELSALDFPNAKEETLYETAELLLSRTDYSR